MRATPRRAKALALSMLALAAAPMAAQAAGVVAFDQPQLKGAATLQVSIPGVTPGGALPLGYTADGRNTSPPISWSGAPPGVKSYVVVLQDPDALSPEPVVHWIVWNIPADVDGLPKGMRNVDSPTTPLGAAQGGNYHGSVGFSGPHPPPGPAHTYHFQVFALNRSLRTRPGSDLRPVLAAMAGHVMASGELVATFAAPAPKSPRTSAKSPAPG